jgi:hypothetical protein
MSSRSKYSRKKMLLPMTLTAVVAASAAAALRTGLGISSVGVVHITDSFIFTPVIPETQAYLDSMTVYLREQLTENKKN